ncbi:MAG: D-alanine--D-alanine ligase [Actinomycetales bacterium]|nr:D-alanine--D-alanine ligase [Actinomycetales bacterium]
MSRTTSGRVLVLAGGLSPERDVSIRSGRRVADALRTTGSDVELRDVDAALLPSLAAERPACVVPLLHGAAGEDGAVRDVLAALGLPFVGSDPTACRRAFDKPVASGLVAAAGVAVPASVALPHSTFRELGAIAVLDAVVARLGLPLMVKPTRGGSSLGATVVRSASELPAAMVASFAYGDTALIEHFVPGTEVAVSVVEGADGPRALPVVEVVADGGFYDYGARYTAGATEFFTPARLPDDVLATCATTAVTVHRTLGLRDWSRSDLVVDAAGTPWFLEVNVAPGMTETSTYPQAVLAAGLDLGELTAELVRRAISRG